MTYATAKDGTRLHYEEAGSGTPVIFIHEFAGDHRSWEPQMRFFARYFRCIAYDAQNQREMKQCPTLIISVFAITSPWLPVESNDNQGDGSFSRLKTYLPSRYTSGFGRPSTSR